MKKSIMLLTVASVILLGSCERTPDGLPQDDDQSLVRTSVKDIPGQYIVLLKDGFTSIKLAKLSYPDAQVLMRSEMQKVLAASEISAKEPLQVYTASVEGFAVRLSEERLLPGVREALKKYHLWDKGNLLYR